MLSVVKMLLKGEVGGRALKSHGNYIVDHGITWKNYGIVFLNFCGNPVSISTVKINVQEIEDYNKISNAFNNCFVSVASNLKEPIKNSNFEKLKTFCNNKLPDGTEFTIPEVSKETVEKFLKHIDVLRAILCNHLKSCVNHNHRFC